MKVVAIDNYARDTVADILIAEGIGEAEAKAMCERLNGPGRPDDRWHVCKPDSYRLSRGMRDIEGDDDK